MTNAVRQPATLSPSPRHMRKRRFRGDVPPSLLPGRQEDEPLGTFKAAAKSNHATVSQDALRAPLARPALVKGVAPKKATPRQKRLVALGTVIIVSLSIPILVLALIFA